MGITGSVLSCFNVLDNLEEVLDIIGIFLGSMGAVMIVYFLGNRLTQKWINLSSWIFGIAGGFLGKLGISLTEVAVLDAFLVALSVMGALQYVAKTYAAYVESEAAS
jgi:hypothetical protein